MTLSLAPYIHGILYSFVFLLATGPSFFYLISLSIKKGFRSGALFASGIILSDIFIVAIIYYGLGNLMETHLFKLIFSGIGGLVLVFLGVKFVLDKEVQIENETEIGNNQAGIKNCIKGFFMNASNPFAFIVWLTLHATLTHTHPEYKTADFLLFFGALFASIACMEVSKAFLADKIGKIMTPKVLIQLNKVLGILFIAIGLWLIYSLIQLLNNQI